MALLDDNEPKKSNFHGLADEIHQVIDDKQFQTTIGRFVPKSDTLFRILKGVGFTLALLSGLFGYLVAANSEADDRKAQMIHKIIDEKKAWAVKVDEGILQLRKTRYLIKQKCDFNKRPTQYEQEKIRFLARHEFVKSYTGIREIFGDEVAQICREFTAFDESIFDICAQDAPNDETWRAFLRRINEQMHLSIKEDREQLKKLGYGIFSEIFNFF